MQSKKICFTLLLFLFVPIFMYANVGFSQQTFTDKTRDRVLQTSIWYPTQAKQVSVFGENVVFKGFEASKDAKIKKGKYPLFVLVHGTSGNWKNLSWLAYKLAQNGAIVIAANHPGYTSADATPSGVIRAWNQPLDVSFLLDAFLKSKYQSVLNEKKIYVIGYSLGGYSAMALAGARLDMKDYLVFCASNKDESCKYFQKTFSGFDAKFYEKSSKDYGDKRVSGIVAIAPGFVEAMRDKSLKNITIPTLIIGAQKDKNVPPSTHFYRKMKVFSKAIRYKEISDASHFSFMQVCKKGALKILAEEEAEFVCKDGMQKSREAIHKELYKSILNFIQNIK
jgi:predicted dienelactone hydrolase